MHSPRTLRVGPDWEKVAAQKLRFDFPKYCSSSKFFFEAFPFGFTSWRLLRSTNEGTEIVNSTKNKTTTSFANTFPSVSTADEPPDEPSTRRPRRLESPASPLSSSRPSVSGDYPFLVLRSRIGGGGECRVGRPPAQVSFPTAK